MQKIDSFSVSDGQHTRTISLWEGNPADTPPEDPVDLIIVSAFHNDYTPTPISIIGALYRKGISVAKLAEDKQVDFRGTAGFWLSKPLPEGSSSVGVRQVLCFEPHTLGGSPPEVVGQLFRGLFPFLPDGRESKVAMAVIATGAIGAEPKAMLRALVSAAAIYMKRGLPIGELRIMEQNPKRSALLAPVFAELKSLATPAQIDVSGHEFQVFLSFSRTDTSAADEVLQALRSSGKSVFDYRVSINTGEVWQTEIERALSRCLKMVALLTPAYLQSPECLEELSMGHLLHKRRRMPFLFPLYTRSLMNDEELPLWLQTINYVDCREADAGKLKAAADRLLLA